MAYTTIDDPSAHFQIALYTGSGSDNAVTNDGNSDLQADLLLCKRRNDTGSTLVFDSSRGFNGDNDSLYMETIGYGAETHNDNDHLKSFNSDGFTMQGASSRSNRSSDTFVAWQWKANGGTTTTNDASSTGVGSEDTVYQANTTAGFSIVTWTGPSGSGVDTRAHGLGGVPHVILVKARSGTENWVMYHHKNTSAPETDVLKLNLTNATADEAGNWNDTAPTSTVFTTGDTGATNEDSKTYVAYIWKEIQGYSKFGTYEGNGDADGAFVYLGFKPAFVIIKNIDGTGDEWVMLTGKIATGTNSNPLTDALYANANNAETGTYTLDFLSNGFKLRHTSGATTTSGETYSYMAWAEQPFVSSKGVPCTAR